MIITAHIKNKQNQSKIKKQKTAKEFLAGFWAGNQINLSVSHNRLS